MCPVLAARWIKKAAQHFGTGPSDPALATSGGHVVSVAWVIKILKSLAQSLGLDPKNYSSHSVRIGGSPRNRSGRNKIEWEIVVTPLIWNVLLYMLYLSTCQLPIVCLSVGAKLRRLSLWFLSLLHAQLGNSISNRFTLIGSICQALEY